MPSPSARERRAKGASLPAFLSVLTLAGLGAGLARVMTSLHGAARGAAPLELGILAASQPLGLVLMSLPSGGLVRRHGPRRVFVAGSLAGGLACAAVPLVPARPFLLVAAATVGLCMPLRFVATHVVALRRLERDGGGRAGWYRGSNLLGMVLLAPAVAVPAATTLGLAAAWSLVAATFLLAAAVAPLVLESERGAMHADEPPPRSARRDPEAPALIATELAAQGAFTYFTFFIVPVAVGRYGFAPSAATALLGAQAASYVVTLFALGGLAASWPRRRFVLAAYGAALAGFGVLGLGRTGAALWAGSLLVGVGLGLVQTHNVVRAARVGARAGQDAAAALQSLSGSSGGLASGLLGGALGQRVGAQAIFLALAPIFALLAWRELDRGGLTRRRSAAPGPTESASSRSRASASEPGACEG